MNRYLFLFVIVATALAPRAAAGGETRYPIRGLDRVERHVLPAVDPAAVRRADVERAAKGDVPHYAVPLEVAITPWNRLRGWESLRENRARWRLRLVSRGALSLNLAFSRYRMPPGGEMWLTAADGSSRIGPFTARDNEASGELWTPPILTNDLVLELRLPVSELDDLELELARVHHGYAGFGEPPPKAGSCHHDVSCSSAEPWRDEARAVALVSIEGVRFCTGFLINNTALDGRPFFVTAHHCGVTRDNAASVVVLWNHQADVCDGIGPDAGRREDFGQFQTGAVLRAAHRASDFVLLELDDPPDPSFRVYYAGWDRSADDPDGSVVIHHPNTDFKRISFDSDRAATTAYLYERADPHGDHLRIGAWELGSTEGGSSGAPLFNRDKRVVGQLHGGHAACGEPRPDWFGRLSAAWTGDGRRGQRLSDWLDPLGTETLVLDGLDGATLPGAVFETAPPRWRTAG